MGRLLLYFFARVYGGGKRNFFCCMYVTATMRMTNLGVIFPILNHFERGGRVEEKRPIWRHLIFFAKFCRVFV